MVSQEILARHIQAALSSQVNLPVEQIFGSDVTLSDLILASDRLANSVDLMEAFARIANGLRKDYGLRIRLPAFSLDTPVATVMNALLSEASNAGVETVDAGR